MKTEIFGFEHRYNYNDTVFIFVGELHLCRADQTKKPKEKADVFPALPALPEAPVNHDPPEPELPSDRINLQHNQSHSNRT